MTIPTDDGRPGQSKPLLGSDDMDDPLSPIAHPEISQPEFLDIVFERGDLGTRVGLGDETGDVFERFSGDRTAFVEVSANPT
jgi:hypothetical protein